MSASEPSKSVDTDKDAVSRLHQAVIAGDESLLRELLDQNGDIADASDAGADIEAVNASGRTLLHQAVDRNNVQLSTLLLERGANVEAATSDGEKPLWIAAGQGYELMAKLLLQCKADVESFNAKSGTTALLEAVKRGHAGLVRLLLDRGADIEARPTGPQAVRGDGASARKKAKVRPSIIDSVDAGHSPPQGVPRPLPRPPPGLPGHALRSSLPNRATPAVLGPARRSHRFPPVPQPGQSLGTLAPDAGQPEVDRDIPLHRAVMNGNIEIVRLLLQHGADTGIQGKDGRSAQQVADEQDLRELAALLRAPPLLEGPEIKKGMGKPLQDAPPLAVPRALPPRHNLAKMAACRYFEATMVEFYPESREQRYQRSAPIYDLLYGNGPKAILDAERPESVAGKTAKFTWYHLPANNMEWVEGLIVRVSTPRTADATAEDRFREKLGICPRKTQKTSSGAMSSFLRPHSKEIKNGTSSEDNVGGVSAAANSSIIAFGADSHHSLSRLIDRPDSRDGSTKSTESQGSDPIHPYMHLITGYFRKETPVDSTPWQPRRSLDGYFYTHLADTSRRDGDQVVLRYTRDNHLPLRIFMVDQLWVWILGNDTIITCSPLTWDSWVADTKGQASKSGNGYFLARQDPMNLHQKIIRHLKRADRQPITSVHDLACLITDTCTSLFDQDEIFDEFRFFDFFERDIARLSDTATCRLEDFRTSLEGAWPPSNSDSMHIKGELSLLIEVQDICDELEMLRKVLKDQNDSMTEMRRILAAKGQTKWTGSRATVSHTQWVDRMEQMATKTKDSLYHLLNLKLKQASFSEAIDIRKQAEDTTRQTTLAAEHSLVMRDQLTTMRSQADETGRQGRVLLAFSVVTIIFLPSSFMAAVFSIDLDTFPGDDNGRLPLAYFLKYLFAISCAVTIPLVYVAFNIPRIATYGSWAKNSLARIWSEDSRILWTGAIGPAVALVIEAAVVGAIWAAPLAAGVKIAVTACISVIVAVAIVLLVFSALKFSAQKRLSPPESDDGTNSGHSD